MCNVPTFFYNDRDHIRYKDPIQCAAARIVASLRKEFGEFDTFHIRRGDFSSRKPELKQPKSTIMSKI